MEWIHKAQEILDVIGGDGKGGTRMEEVIEERRGGKKRGWERRGTKEEEEKGSMNEGG